MKHDLMKDCEQKRPFMRDGKKILEWAQTPVSALDSGVDRSIRCLHCHGAVQVHKRKVPHGPEDHVEHQRRQDSERCRGGVYFKGTHQISLTPVE